MEKNVKNIKLNKLILSAIVAFAGLILIDIITALFVYSLSVTQYVIIFIVLFTPTLFIHLNSKTLIKVTVIILCLIVFILGSFYAIKAIFRNNSEYKNVDNGKSAMYADKTVLLIAPHQDDDINLLGGVIDEFVHYGSNVYVVFTTDGNYYGIGQERIEEAYNVADAYGIPRGNFIFMGYPDSGKYAADTHFYNIPDSEVRLSFCNDMKELLNSIRPDIIFCNDYDEHPDHKATSLLFEEALSSVLKDNAGYTPIVYKGFAYSTGYTENPAYESYYTTNISRTQNPYGTDYMLETNNYMWGDRVRLPVKGDTLSRSLYTSSTYKICGLYKTQDMQLRAAGFIRGDKVFWQRRTDSILYDCGLKVSSGNGDKLTDFKIVDSNMIIYCYQPMDGAWIPDAEDNDKTIDITLKKPVNMSYISLYDNPSLDDNIINAEITINGREAFTTGALPANGSAANYYVEDVVSSIRIKLLDTEGDNAGLTEIEAFSSDVPENEPYFVKLEDTDDNFAYDYHLSRDGIGTFKLYSYNCSGNLDDYEISCDNEKCEVTADGDVINVYCPVGQSTILTVSGKSGNYSDSILITNPFDGDILQKLELLTINNQLHNTIIYKALNGIRNIV